jgi:CRP/FNR family transcriptional regulator, anaerobic regulatory protein
MKEQVVQFLHQAHPLSEGLQEALLASLKEMRLAKKEIYLREGETSKKIAFILQGLMRSYYINAKGEEITNWFMKEGDVAISVKSFFEQLPSKEFIAAIEPTVLLYVTYNELQHLYNTYPEFNIVGRRLTERYYTLCEERLLGIRSLTAKQRYDFLLQWHPEIIERCPNIHIASYLDMNKATLARLKRTNDTYY